MKFKYKHFICNQDELQGTLTLRGEEGWRLHTCEPVMTMGQQGTGLMEAFVVMDQAYETDNLEEEEVYEPDEESEGLSMKG